MKNLKKKKNLIESQKGSMNKFVIINKQNITQNLDGNITNEQEIHQKELEDNEMIQLQDVCIKNAPFLVLALGPKMSKVDPDKSHKTKQNIPSTGK